MWIHEKTRCFKTVANLFVLSVRQTILTFCILDIKSETGDHLLAVSDLCRYSYKIDNYFRDIYIYYKI